MKQPIWHNQAKGKARDEFIAFAAGRDVAPIQEADEALIPYDIWTNRAHALVLRKLGIFTKEEIETLLACFDRLEQEWMEGTWKLDPALEDVHINIEAYVSEVCGESMGGRLHTGRSRNDQVATDMKLLCRDVVLSFLKEILGLTASLIRHAKKHLYTVMPGYTHHRKATITSWAHWCVSYAQGLLRDAQRLMDLYARINACPLGAAASYGTTWNLDRRLSAKLLGFDEVQINTLDAVSSRGEAETEIAFALSMVMKRLSCFCQDLILFSTDEFGYIRLPSDFTTGSSIMPQKRNPDFAEAIKGKLHVAIGIANTLLSMNSGNLAGYNKDIQWSKYAFLDLVRECRGSAFLLSEVVPALKVEKANMEKAARVGFLNAVDIADFLAKSRNIPFRTTYRLMSESVGLSKDSSFHLDDLNTLLRQQSIKELSDGEFRVLSDPTLCLNKRNHLGSPAAFEVKSHLQRLGKDMALVQRWINRQTKIIHRAIDYCKTITLI